MDITNKAKELVNINGITWLAQKLGLNRGTIYERLKKENWKVLEIEKLIKL